MEYQHLLRKWDFTTQIKSVVKQILFCSANLFPFLECFVSEQFAHPSYEVLATLKKRLGFSGETLFHPELEQDDEINQFIGKYLACSERDRKILIRTLNCLANELLCKADTSEVDTEDTK